MKSPSFTRRVLPILTTHFIDNFGLAIVYPIFTSLLLDTKIGLLSSGVSHFNRMIILGLLIASFPLAQFFGAPLIGSLSDRIGRRKVLITTISGGIIGYILTGIGIHYRLFYLLWIGRTLTGFFAGNLTVCLAVMADLSPHKEMRARNFGWIGAIGGFSFILAILVGGLLSNPQTDLLFKPDFPFFITAFLSVVNLALMIFLFQESHVTHPTKSLELVKGVKNIRFIWENKDLRPIYGCYFLFMMAWVASMQFLPTYLLRHFSSSAPTITWIFLGIGTVWSLANLIINPPLTKRFWPPKIFMGTLLILTLILFSSLIPQPEIVFLILFLIGALCAGLGWTNGLTTVSLHAPAALQGSILGVNQSMSALASTLGPAIGGAIAGIKIQALFPFAALCSGLAAYLIYRKNRV